MGHISASRPFRVPIGARLSALAIGTWSAFIPLHAGAAIHALVIGINDYRPDQDIARLDGAVNDARDVADAIRSLGATNVELLLDKAAHRDAIFAAWNRLIASARKGDTLILTYAGHGGREPEKVKGSTKHGMVETTLLAGFGSKSPDNYQRIYDYEWRTKIEQAKHLNVITMFDSCNSGTPTRPLVLDVPPKIRFVHNYNIIDDTLSKPIDTKVESRRIEFMVAPNETFIGGTLDGDVVYEIDIEGKPRGAASYFFARALRGHADANGDRVLTRGELHDYIVQNVRTSTEARQTATVEFFDPDARDSALLSVPKPMTTQTAARIPVAITGAAGDQGKALKNATVVSETKAALVWRADQGTVVNQNSADAAATGINSIEQFQRVVDKWFVLQRIKQLAEAHPMDVRFDQGDKLHKGGDKVTIRVKDRKQPHLTLVNLASDGTVQLLPSDSQDVLANVSVVAPFGADHLLAIATPAKPKVLINALNSINNTPKIEDLYRALRQQTDTGAYQIGILGFYTASP